MAVVTDKFGLETQGASDLIDVTPEVARALERSELTNGICNVFVPGSTGALTTLEYEPGLVNDVKDFFDRVIPEGDYDHNRRWGDGNGHAHVRAALVGPSVSIPFADRSLLLGRWQQIVFADLDNRPRSRELTVTMVGE